MQFLRKIFFYIFAAIYVVTCPLLIMYAFGYILAPGTKDGYEKTGLIYLSTAPPGASVYVNGKLNSQQTPAVIRDLLPSGYSVKLDLEGYRSWSMNVPVEAEKATVLDRVILLPDEWKSPALLAGAFSDIVPVPGSGYFLVFADKTLGSAQVCNCSGEDAWPLLEKDSPFREYSAREIFSARGSPAVVIHAGIHGDQKYLWVKFGSGTNDVEEISGLFPGKPEEIKWIAGQESMLFVLTGKRLEKVDVNAGAVYPEYLSGLKGYGLYNGAAYILKDDNTLITADYEGKTTKELLDDPDTGSSIFGQKEKFDIEVFDEDLMVFLGDKGELLANKLPYRFVDRDVRGVEYYDKREHLLLWKKDRIGILDFSAEETGNVEFQKGPKLVWIYTRGSDIEQCFWAYDGSHVLFRDGSKILLLGVESYGEFTIKGIFGVKSGASIYYSDDEGKVYFLDSTRGIPRSAQIFLRKGLIEAPLEEALGERKKTKIQELWNSNLPETD